MSSWNEGFELGTLLLWDEEPWIGISDASRLLHFSRKPYNTSTPYFQGEEGGLFLHIFSHEKNYLRASDLEASLIADRFLDPKEAFRETERSFTIKKNPR